jgi:hypothetical protein
MVGALVKTEKLAETTAWHMTCFGPSGAYEVARSNTPKTVESVVHHRVIDKKHIVAGVSGGVRIDPWKLVKPAAIEIDRYGRTDAEHSAAKPKQLAPDAWWWD